MKDNTERYLSALRNGGPILLAIVVIEDELKCDFVKSTSKIVGNPKTALRAILESILDMDVKVLESLLLGTFLTRHWLPIPDFTNTTVDSQNSDTSVKSTLSQRIVDGITSGKWEVESIVGMRVVDGVTFYRVHWKDFGSKDDTWQPMATLYGSTNWTCLPQLQDFHTNNPSQPPTRHIGDISETLLPIKDAKELGIYCLLFVGATESAGILEAPPTAVMYKILEKMQFYCEDIPATDPRYRRQQKFIEKVDNPDPQYGLNYDTSDPDEKFHYPDTRQADIQTFIAIKMQECNEIDQNEWDDPFPLPLAECGLASNFHQRKKGHITHSSTTPLLAFWECVSLAIYGGEYRWIFQPIVHCRDGIHYAILESFFSRLLQTYIHLGGANIDAAGKSSIAGLKFTTAQRVAALDDVDYKRIDRNLAIAVKKLTTMRYVASEADRANIQMELVRVGKEVEENKFHYYKGFFEVLDKLNDNLRFHEQMREDDEEVVEALSVLERMESLRGEMEELRNSGGASI